MHDVDDDLCIYHDTSQNEHPPPKSAFENENCQWWILWIKQNSIYKHCTVYVGVYSLRHTNL